MSERRASPRSPIYRYVYHGTDIVGSADARIINTDLTSLKIKTIHGYGVCRRWMSDTSYAEYNIEYSNTGAKDWNLFRLYSCNSYITTSGISLYIGDKWLKNEVFLIYEYIKI